MADPIITPTTSTDIPALQRVLDETGLFPGELLPDLLAPHFAGANADIWLTSQADGGAVGLCYVSPEEMAEGTWNMRALAIHPDRQQQGLGAALVAEAEKRLRADAQRILIVDTSGVEAFSSARAFYARIGYDEEARVREFWGPGDDKVIYRKAL